MTKLEGVEERKLASRKSENMIEKERQAGRRTKGWNMNRFFIFILSSLENEGKGTLSFSECLMRGLLPGHCMAMTARLLK